MMTVADSSAWIEWLTDSPTARGFAHLMPKAEDAIVPTIVQYEVVKWLRRETDEERADAFLAYTMQCQVMPLDTDIAMLAVNLSTSEGLAMADAIVLATARKTGAALITCDALFRTIERVTYIANGENNPA